MIDRCPFCNSNSINKIFVKDEYFLGKCQNCKLVFILNPPTSAHLEKLYSFNSDYHKNFLDENSFDSKRSDKIGKEHFSYVKKFLDKGKILDVGCSAGFFIKHADKDGWEAMGTELSEDTTKIGREKYKLNIIATSFDKFDSENNSFDVITMWDVIEHLEDPILAVKKAYELLKPGGMFFISTPNIDGIFPKASFQASKLIKKWPHPEPPFHLFQFSCNTLTNILKQNKFAIKEVVHERIDIDYSFGSFKSSLTSPKKFLYFVLFAPLAYLGPFIHMGDSMIITAQKKI